MEPIYQTIDCSTGVFRLTEWQQKELSQAVELYTNSGIPDTLSTSTQNSSHTINFLYSVDYDIEDLL